MFNEWSEVGKWNVGQPCGASEIFILERNLRSGDFRLKNDFGNIQIDLDLMAGIEFLRKVLETMEAEVFDDVNSWIKSLNAKDPIQSNPLKTI